MEIIYELINIEEVSSFLDRSIDISHTSLASEISTLSDYIEVWKTIPLNYTGIVIIMLPNSKCILEHFFSLLFLGFIPLVIPFTTPAVQLNEMCKSFNVSAVVSSRDISSHIKQFSNQWNRQYKNDHWFIWYCEGQRPSLSSNSYVILGTSGTSGPSTGCLFNFEKLIQNAKKHSQAIGLQSKDVMLVNLPLCYSYALIAQALSSYLTGGTLVISSPPFNSDNYLKNIENYNVNVSSLTPLLTKEILENNPKIFNKLKKLTIGGGKISSQNINKIINHAKNLELFITYGLTEAGPRVSTLPAHLSPCHTWDSVGIPLPDTQTMIQNGELYIHSNTMLNNRIGRVSKETFINFNEKEWLITGDSFKYDNDGYLYYQGRRSDFEIIKGEKIHLKSIKEFCNSLNEIAYSSIELKQEKTSKIYNLNLYLKNEFDLEQSEQIKRKIMLGLRPAERPDQINIAYKQLEDIKYK